MTADKADARSAKGPHTFALDTVTPGDFETLTYLLAHAENDNVIVFSKRSAPEDGPDTDDVVLVVCSLDGHATQISSLSLDMPQLGLDWHDRFAVQDQITGETYHWGQFAYVELNPHHEPAHILVVRRYG